MSRLAIKRSMVVRLLIGLLCFMPLVGETLALASSMALPPEVFSSLPSFVVTSGLNPPRIVNAFGDGWITHLLRRRLEIGDFESINEVVGNSTIYLSDTTITDRFLGITLTLILTNLRCSNLHVGDITLDYTMVSPTTISFTVRIVELDARCFSDYSYSYGIFGGMGFVDAMSNNSNATFGLAISQPSTTQPPIDSVAGGCTASVIVTDLVFTGGIVARILNLASGLVSGVIETQLNDFICDFVPVLDNYTSSLLQTVADLLDPYLNTTINSPDPLVAETALAQENLMSLLNFQDPQDALGVAIDTLLEETSSYLASEVSDANAPADKNGVDLGVNTLLRNSVLDSDNAFIFSAENFSFIQDTAIVVNLANVSTFTLSVDYAKLSGLDSFTLFDALIQVGNYSLANNFSLSFLEVEIGLMLTLSSPSDDVNVTENVKLEVVAHDIDLEATLLLGVNLNKLSAIELGSLFTTANILPCLFSTIQVVNITSMMGSIGSIADPVLSGFDSPGLERIMVTLVEAIYELYDDLIAIVIPNFIATTLRDILNEQIETLTANATCPEGGSFMDPFMDFRDFFLAPEVAKEYGGSGTQPYGDLGAIVKGALDTQILANDASTGMPQINEVVIQPITEAQSGTPGTLLVYGDLFNFNAGIDVGALVAQIAFVASEARIENLDTVTSPLVLLEPLTGLPYTLDNSVGFGFDERPLRGSLRLLLYLDGDGLQLSNEVDIDIDLTDVRADFLLFAQIVATRLMSFPLRDILNLNCWLATIPAPPLDSRGVRLSDSDPTLSILDLGLSLKKISLGVRCVNCSSPELFTLSDLLAAPESANATTQAANVLLTYIITLFEANFLQVNLDRLLNEAPSRCPSSPMYKADSESPEFEPFATNQSSQSLGLVVTLVATVIGLLVFVTVFRLVILWLVRRRHKWWIRTLPTEQVFRIHRQQSMQRERCLLLDDQTSAMFLDEAIPAFVRFFIPLVLLANIGFFLSGHLSVGGTVKVDAEFAGEDIIIENFFEFSIARSTVDLWNAGGREIAVLIILFSGVWPYSRLVLTLLLWFLPPTRVSVMRRGSIFIWLDNLTKWSTIDVFVLILALISFRVSVASPGLAFLPDDFYVLDIFVVPLWGLYSNLIAQLLSQIASHFIIHYHRKIVSTALDRTGEDDDDGVGVEGGDPSLIEGKDQRNDNDNEAESLNAHAYARPHRGEASRLEVRPGVNSLVLGCGVALFGLVVGGCVLPSFMLEFLGLIGVAVEIGQEFEAAIVEYGVFTIVGKLFDQARSLGGAGNYIGLAMISLILLFTVLIVPLVQSVCILWGWFRPMTQKSRNRLEVFMEILRAWQYIEVFVIAVILSSWQLGDVSESLINSYCDGLSGTFASLVFYGILREDDAQCFKVNASLSIGTYILIAASFCLWFLTTFVTQAVFHYQYDKAQDEARLSQGLDETTTVRLMEKQSVEDIISQIEPIPVLFTDNFRWLFVSKATEREESEYDEPIRFLSDQEEPLIEEEKEEEEEEEPAEGAPTREDVAEREHCSEEAKVAESPTKNETIQVGERGEIEVEPPTDQPERSAPQQENDGDKDVDNKVP